jgi:hypothetical protein
MGTFLTVNGSTINHSLPYSKLEYVVVLDINELIIC